MPFLLDHITVSVAQLCRVVLCVLMMECIPGIQIQTLAIAARNNYGYGYENYFIITSRVYTLMPNDSQDLNETVCAPNNREGFLCEDCVPGYGPTAYSPK